MDDVRIYDTGFNLLHIENKIISSDWTVKFNAVGTFEIHTLADTKAAETIVNNLSIAENKIPVVVQGDLQGVVTGVRLHEDCAIYGKTLNWFLTRKTVPSFTSSSFPEQMTEEELIRKLVAEAFYDQPDFVLGEKAGIDTVNPVWRNTYNPLSEVVSDILEKHHAGHRVVFDPVNKRWVFEIVPCNYPAVVISTAMGNAFGQEYLYSIDGYSSECWYQQEQEFIEGEFPEPVWTKLVKDEKTGIFRNECVVEAVEETEAQNILDKKQEKSEIVTKVCGLSLGRDYNVGDILRVQFEKGNIAKTGMKQISGISLGWEDGIHTREVMLKNI